jgi:hypothetical protein
MRRYLRVEDELDDEPETVLRQELDDED